MLTRDEYKDWVSKFKQQEEELNKLHQQMHELDAELNEAQDLIREHRPLQVVK